jgi:Flp pilus assembly protein TadG
MRLRSWGRRTGRQRGQALVEFTLILPIILILVLSMAEIGLAIGNNMSLELATREGARVGASLANGGGTPGCGTGQSPNAATVDPQIIASVERALSSSGSGVDMSKVDYVHIYESNSDGSEGLTNVWTYSAGGGPVVGGIRLDFVQGTVAWQVCSRTSAPPPDSIGVSISYRYKLITPLSILTGMFGANQITMVDRTIMALEPSQ